MHKLKFWGGQSRKSRKAIGVASRRRKKRLQHGAALGIESLEDRYLLAANPILTVPSGQFFAEASPLAPSIPFRATFSDVIDFDGEDVSITSFIDWGDGFTDSSTDPGTNQQLFVRPTLSVFTGETEEGGAVVGRLEGFHSYAVAGSYNVSVTLTDGSGLTATLSIPVNVYPVDPSIQITGATNSDEGSLYTLDLSAAGGANENISSWAINWGDTIETLSGNPTQATHTYGDDRNYGGFYPSDGTPHGALIGATVTGENGTFVVGSPSDVAIQDVASTASVTAPSDVTEGQPYTLNLDSYTDPGDPLLNWIVIWDVDNFTGSESEATILPPDATTATHVYPAPGTYSVLWFASNGFDSPAGSLTVTIHPTPTATFASDGAVDEGSAGSVSFSDPFYSDPVVAAAGFRYAYDFNNDGIWEIGDGTYSGSVAAANAIVPAEFIPDGDAQYTVKGRIIAQDEAYKDYTALVVVANVAPALTLAQPSVTANEGDTVTNSGTFGDILADTVTLAASIGTITGSAGTWSWSYNTTDNAPSQTVTITASDEDGGSTSVTFQLTVNNVAPTITRSQASLTVNEGTTATNTGTFGDVPADTVTLAASIGTITGGAGAWSWAYNTIDNAPPQTVTITASDEDGGSMSVTFQLTVNNVAPTANAGGPYATFDDTPIMLSGLGTDPAGAADPLAFTWDLDGDNIFGETGSGATRGNEVGANVTYNPTGLPTSTQTVTLQVSDGDGGVTVATTTVQILGQGTLVVGGVLYIVGGNSTNDIVLITQSGSTIGVCATFNSSNPQTFSTSAITDIQVRTRGGNDIVLTTSSVMETMTIDGGAGNDLLTGGGAGRVIIGGTGNDILYGAAGNDILLGGDGNDDLFGGDGSDVLVGGNGNDILNGGHGRDVLVGSQDNDRLEGGDGDDVLIGGFTIHDNNVATLDAVMAIWNSAASFSSRVATLTASGGLLQAGVAVFDDDDRDTLIGDAGRDLYFGDNNPADHVTDSISLQALQDQLIAVT